jgi:Na+-driven multidrug efflux pump
MALVFPGVMLMQMISAGAMGGGISSAIARALGAGRHDDADALVLHAIVINVVLGGAFAIAVLLFGRSLYAALGGEGASLEAALVYSNIVFGGNVLLWVMNGLASVIRGTGNMLFPALVICVGALALVPLSPVLIFGWGPIPAMGIAGGGFALVLFYIGGFAVLGWYVLSGRNIARFKIAPLRWTMAREILRVGAVAAVSSIQTNVTIGLVTGLVGMAAGPAALAGFGTAARLEYLLVPMVFGIGGPLVAMVGTNIGAGQRDRALRIAWIGAAIAALLCEIIGVAAAIWPAAWLGLFDSDPAMLQTGSAYLRAVGPFYGCFGFGLALYFASQGAGKLLWPLIVGFARVAVAIGGGWIALKLTGSLWAMFIAVGLALLVYGAGIAASVKLGAWFPRAPAKSGAA